MRSWVSVSLARLRNNFLALRREVEEEDDERDDALRPISLFVCGRCMCFLRRLFHAVDQTSSLATPGGGGGGGGGSLVFSGLVVSGCLSLSCHPNAPPCVLLCRHTKQRSRPGGRAVAFFFSRHLPRPSPGGSFLCGRSRDVRTRRPRVQRRFTEIAKLPTWHQSQRGIVSEKT